MNAKDLAGIAAAEACERAGSIIVTVDERCELEGCPLTPEQRLYLNTGVLAAFMGIGETLEGMCDAFEVLQRFAASPFSEPLVTDEGLNAWLRGDLGQSQ